MGAQVSKLIRVQFGGCSDLKSREEAAEQDDRRREKRRDEDWSLERVASAGKPSHWITEPD